MNKKEYSYLKDRILTFTKNTDWIIKYEFNDEINEITLDPNQFTAGEYRLFTQNLFTYFSNGYKKYYDEGPVQAFKDLNTILGAHLDLLQNRDFKLSVHQISSLENLSKLWKEMLKGEDDFPKHIRKLKKNYRRQKLKKRLQSQS